MRHGLWKTVENFAAVLPETFLEGEPPRTQLANAENTLQISEFLACSGCSGDYEDPDVTAWREDFDESDEVDEGDRATTAEEFPVQRN